MSKNGNVVWVYQRRSLLEEVESKKKKRTRSFEESKARGMKTTMVERKVRN
jgi:hypothetical protein